MTIMFVRHHVADYNAWRRVYDSVADMQRQGGVTEEAVYRAQDDPNDILVMHPVQQLRRGALVMQNPDLRQAMADSGVDPSPVRAEFYEQV